ncbi:MAG: MlaD family protein, partial [Geothrix sp.]|nr:MlaD family protein [Geothrix sp.]
MKLETKVGLFFTGAIILLAVLIFRTEKLEIGGKRNQTEQFTYFDQVAGLNLQSAVRIAGVKVGDVRAIALENGKARVVVGLSNDVPVYADAFVSLGSIGILGEKFIDLDPGHSAKGPFPVDKP